MKIIDLTHRIAPNMPVYPGTEGPRFEPANSYEKNGFQETLVTMFTHTGTHMDPPKHLFAEGKTLDQLPITHFVGKAVVIDCSSLHEGGKITMDFLHKQMELAEQAEWLLFRTGWDRYWESEKYFGDYPTIDTKVAEYIAKTKKKGIGLDVIGLDPIADENLTLHKIVLANDYTVIVENLKNLDLLGDKPFTLCAIPLYLEEADGSPIRAFAMVEEARGEIG